MRFRGIPGSGGADTSCVACSDVASEGERSATKPSAIAPGTADSTGGLSLYFASDSPGRMIGTYPSGIGSPGWSSCCSRGEAYFDEAVRGRSGGYRCVHLRLRRACRGARHGGHRGVHRVGQSHVLRSRLKLAAGSGGRMSSRQMWSRRNIRRRRIAHRLADRFARKWLEGVACGRQRSPDSTSLGSMAGAVEVPGANTCPPWSSIF